MSKRVAMIRTVQDFIDMLGGTRAAADWACTTDSAVSMWIKRGCLPGGYHTRAIYEIKSRGRKPSAALFDLTEEQAKIVFGEHPNPRPTPRRRAEGNAVAA